MIRESPTVRYAKGSNGWVAYETIGDGPADVVLLPGPISHLDLLWDEPSCALFLRNLASFCRLLIFDRSGIGLSDPVIDGRPTPEQTAEDFLAVLGAAGMATPTIVGISGGGCLAALFAATNPDRISALVLYSSYARLGATADPSGLLDGRIPAFVEGATDYRTYARRNPTVRDDERVDRWTERFIRSAGSPRVIRDVLQMMRTVDIGSVLGDIQAPTLVIARRDDATISVEHSRYLAANIPDAELVVLPGDDHCPWFGDASAVVAAIERFVVGSSSARRGATLGVPLTPRERDVVELLQANLTAREVGQRLYISSRTVETHIAHVYAKLGINSRFELSQRASG